MRKCLTISLGVVLLTLAAPTFARADWVAGRDLAAAIFQANLGNTPADTNAPANPTGQWSWGVETTLGGTFQTTFNSGGGSPVTYGYSTTIGGDSGIQGFKMSSGDVPDSSVNVTGMSHTPSFGLTDSSLAPLEAFMHPGIGGLTNNGVPVPPFAAFQWTAPSTGVYSVSGFFQELNSANLGVQDAVLVNNNLTSPILNVHPDAGSTTTVNFSAPSLALSAGDTIQFLLGPNYMNGNNGTDHTGFNATITLVPEPSSAVLLALGALGLGLFARGVHFSKARDRIVSEPSVTGLICRAAVR